MQRYFVIKDAAGDVVTFGETTFPGDIQRLTKRSGHVVTELDAPFVPVRPTPPPPTPNDIKAYAGKLLAATDWYVTRQIETGVAVPEAIGTYRAAVRDRSGEIETMSPIPPDFRDPKYWP